MRCRYCGKMNPPESYYCGECSYPLHQGSPPQHPPQGSDGGKTASIVVIVVVIIIAVFVLGSCVMSGILYVWVTSLADTEERIDNLRLNIQDGPTSLDGDGADFTTGDEFLKIEQTGGDPIDWNDYIIYCEVSGSGIRKELKILGIGGNTFDPLTNHESRTGQIIMLGVRSNGDFVSGDYVDVTIIKGDAKVYSQMTIRVV